MRIHVALLCLLFSLTLQANPIETEIRDISDGILSGEDTDFLPVEVVTDEIIHLFYQARDYQPAWQDRVLALGVLEELRRSEEHGLNPADYHVPQLESRLDSWLDNHSPRTRAIFDVMLTDGVLLYVRHLLEGKVNPEPLEFAWNYSRVTVEPEQVVTGLNTAIAGGQLMQTIRSYELDSPFYRLLQAELRRYRDLEATGEFMPVPAGQVLRQGDTHAVVPQIRARLHELGMHASGIPEVPELFDQELDAGVRLLQDLHGLDQDGVVGRNTYAAMNMSWQHRVEKIRINMDRLRWVERDRSRNFVLVNIAGYELYLVKDGELDWQTDVMVGKVSTETPMFQARIKYLVFNPTWTVPRSIIGRSLYGKFASDPEYAVNNDFRFYDRDGREVSAEDINWDGANRWRFPYRVVQQPGTHNALGQVKFMFPNRHAIYLHDTPGRELFKRTDRAFSAGCIRVKDPFEFARRLLDDDQQWSAEQVLQTVDTRALRNVYLDNPIDVLLMYWTASPSRRHGRVRFHPDVYQRDDRVLRRLDAAPKWQAL